MKDLVLHETALEGELMPENPPLPIHINCRCTKVTVIDDNNIIEHDKEKLRKLSNKIAEDLREMGQQQIANAISGNINNH
jgi:hypothetical protein